MDLPTLVATLVGGIAATVAAFAGSLYLERQRERSRYGAGARAVLVELHTMKMLLDGLIDPEGAVWPGPVPFSRLAWDTSRPDIATRLDLPDLVAIEEAYQQFAVLRNAIEDTEAGFEMALLEDYRWPRDVRAVVLRAEDGLRSAS